MINLVIRFIFVYFFMVFSMKLMGKRQVGQMQMSELVGAFFLSELATYTVTDLKIPLLYSLVLILLMIGIEVFVSFLTVKIPLFKKMFDFAPSLLIREGRVLRQSMRNNRLTLDELLSMLRLNGYYRVSDVRFAFLEPNGQLSVVPFPEKENVCCSDLGLNGDSGGFSVAVINDGKINRKALELIHKSEAWLNGEMKKYGEKDSNAFFVMSSDLKGNTVAIKKET